MLRITNEGFWLNDQFVRKLFGRSRFKLANILTYFYTGQGSQYNPGYVRRIIEHDQKLFGEHVVQRVFLETGGWEPTDEGMFGSEPRDQGFWQRHRLRDGARETDMHPVGKKVLEELYRVSEETGVVLELVIDATLKHDDIPKGEIDHVIRQVGVKMGELNEKYPKALIIPNVRNEWNAHNQSGHTLQEVNMWAVRWARDKYTEPWMRPVVDPGGGDTFDYDVGPEQGKFAMGLIHPDRGDDWWNLPPKGPLVRDARGMPVGFSESMYYVDRRDADRASRWYGRRKGYTHDFGKWAEWVQNCLDAPWVQYFIAHDEMGVGCKLGWPRDDSPFEREFGNTGPPPPPPPPPAARPTVHISAPEVNGVRSIAIHFPGWPKVVKGVTDEDAVTEHYEIELPEDYTFYAAGSFIGVDRGDIGEYAITAELNGTMLYTRSLHKESIENFDAEDWQYTAWQRGRKLRVVLVARTTGPNDVLRPGQEWSSRPHLALRLWTYPQKAITNE